MQYLFYALLCDNAKFTISQITYKVYSYIKICMIVSQLRLRDVDYVVIYAVDKVGGPDENKKHRASIFPFDPTQHCQ